VNGWVEVLKVQPIHDSYSTRCETAQHRVADECRQFVGLRAASQTLRRAEDAQEQPTLAAVDHVACTEYAICTISGGGRGCYAPRPVTRTSLVCDHLPRRHQATREFARRQARRRRISPAAAAYARIRGAAAGNDGSVQILGRADIGSRDGLTLSVEAGMTPRMQRNLDELGVNVPQGAGNDPL